MKITILVEDSSPGDIEHEHGLSAFVEFGGKCILFDTGQSGMFITNANKLGIDLAKTDFVVISHGHYDHAGGLPDFMKKYDTSLMKFVSHPGIFERKVHGSRDDIGCPVSRESIEAEFGECIFTKDQVALYSGAAFLGEVQRKHENPGTCAEHIQNGKTVPDPVEDDSALVFKTGGGTILLAGCSHSGILNLAKEANKQNNLYTIIGGFHLGNASEERLDKIISEFRNMSINELRPGHCTGGHAIDRMEKELGARRITTGEVIEL
jgi:7,8-dihydropterin-6-yl-methyl-4-(beta-D-ribofuranosyl)aminobenzene 5'-phosphate synthase